VDRAPEQSPELPKPRSAARTWLRILAWITPGAVAPAWLLGWFVLSYGNQRHAEVVTIGAITLLVVIVLGCGFFNAILRPRPHLDAPGARTKSIVLSVVIFTLPQILITPILFFLCFSWAS